MDQETERTPIDFEYQLRRSRGRGARVFSASAKVTREEHTALEAAARFEGKALSEWCRETLLAAARRETVTPTFTEVVAIRQLLNAALEPIACCETVTREDYLAQLQKIRGTKHKAAAEVMQQYAAREKG